VREQRTERGIRDGERSEDRGRNGGSRATLRTGLHGAPPSRPAPLATSARIGRGARTISRAGAARGV
jgi:hypothetical protein